jgi:hypothetical protein
MGDVPTLKPEQWAEVDVYWTVHDGRRFSISLSERDAWESLESLHDYAESPEGWTVEHSRETVPTATGEIVEGEGEIVELDDDAAVASRTSFTPVHVFWKVFGVEPHATRTLQFGSANVEKGLYWLAGNAVQRAVPAFFPHFVRGSNSFALIQSDFSLEISLR